MKGKTQNDSDTEEKIKEVCEQIAEKHEQRAECTMCGHDAVKSVDRDNTDNDLFRCENCSNHQMVLNDKREAYELLGDDNWVAINDENKIEFGGDNDSEEDIVSELLGEISKTELENDYTLVISQDKIVEFQVDFNNRNTVVDADFGDAIVY